METIKRLIDKKILKCSYADYEEVSSTCCLHGEEKNSVVAALYNLLLDKDSTLFFAKFTEDRVKAIEDAIVSYNAADQRSSEFRNLAREIDARYLVHTSVVSLHKPFLKDFSHIKSTEVYKRFAKEKRMSDFYNLLLAGFFLNQDIMNNMIKTNIVIDPLCAIMSRAFEEKYNSFRKYSVFMQTHLDKNVTYELSLEDMYENGIFTIAFITSPSQFFKYYESNFKINIVRDFNDSLYFEEIKNMFISIKDFVHQRRSVSDMKNFRAVLGCALGSLLIIDKELIKRIFSAYPFSQDGVEIFFDGMIYGISEDEYSVSPNIDIVLNKRLEVSNIYIELVEEGVVTKRPGAYNPILLILRNIPKTMVVKENESVSSEFYYRWYNYFVVPLLTISEEEIENEQESGRDLLAPLQLIFSSNWTILKNNLRDEDKAVFFKNTKRLQYTSLQKHMNYFFPKFIETSTKKKRYLQSNLEKDCLDVNPESPGVIVKNFYFKPSFSHDAKAAVSQMSKREIDDLINLMSSYDLYENRVLFPLYGMARNGNLDKKLIRFLISRTSAVAREDLVRAIADNILYANKGEEFLEMVSYLSNECDRYGISILKHLVDKKFFSKTNAYGESNFIIVDRLTDKICNLNEYIAWIDTVRGAIKK